MELRFHFHPRALSIYIKSSFFPHIAVLVSSFVTDVVFVVVVVVVVVVLEDVVVVVL